MALQHIVMHVGNHRVGVRGIALDVRNGSVHVDNSYMSIHGKLGLE